MTKAQIKADILERLRNQWIQPDDAVDANSLCWEAADEIERQRTALAAAQVGEQPFLCPQCGARGYVKDGATTATAQVGERDEVESAQDAELKRVIINEANATIERCKQVVEDILGPSDPRTPPGYDVLAALDKLKDAP